MQIKCEGLSIDFASSSALSGLTFSIESGDFVGIIGPNGSGKTTLLKSLSGILTPSKGIVELDGRPLKDYSPQELALMMGQVPQKTSTDFAFTVWEMVAMGLYSRRKQQRRESWSGINEAKVKWAIGEMNLTKLAQRPITSLSGGEFQRVLIARALAQEPEIILLDEVTTHLDIRYKLDILEKIYALNKHSGMTVVAVLHELELAAEFASKLLVLADGQIHSYGSPKDVLTRKMLHEVFDVDMQVVRGVLGEISLQPIKSRAFKMRPENSSNSSPIHLIAGGGSGIEILQYLASKGYTLTLGAINRDDADWVTGREYQVKMAEEIPFSPLSSEVRAENRRLMQAAEEIIVTDVPFGPGNVSNLADLLTVLDGKKKVYLLDSTPIEDRDFTEGVATGFWQELLASGAVPVPSKSDLLDEISREE